MEASLLTEVSVEVPILKTSPRAMGCMAARMVASTASVMKV